MFKTGSFRTPSCITGTPVIAKDVTLVIEHTSYTSTPPEIFMHIWLGISRTEDNSGILTKLSSAAQPESWTRLVVTRDTHSIRSLADKIARSINQVWALISRASPAIPGLR
ncbi:hypothetical protein TNCV_3426361 [Trichonephila clavipes]|nr:hypothetical protein TNCV_3426361 [Trichonephila clavipes]